MGLLFPDPSLVPGEGVVLRRSANRLTPDRAFAVSAGRILVTDRSLIFQPHRLDSTTIKSESVRIALSRIRSVSLGTGTPVLLPGVNAVRVSTDDSEEVFIVRGGRDFVRRISALAGVPISEPGEVSLRTPNQTNRYFWLLVGLVIVSASMIAKVVVGGGSKTWLAISLATLAWGLWRLKGSLRARG